MSGWRVVLWRRDRRGRWSEVAAYPGDRVADALERANALNVTNSELHAVLPVGQRPTE